MCCIKIIKLLSENSFYILFNEKFTKMEIKRKYKHYTIQKMVTRFGK